MVSVVCLWRSYTLLRRLNFSAIFLLDFNVSNVTNFKRQGAWDGSGKRAVRGRIKIFLLLYNGSVVKVSANYIVLYASQTIKYCWGFRSRKIAEPFEGRVEGIAAYLLVQYRETASSGFRWMCLSWYHFPQTIDGRVASALHDRLDGLVACAHLKLKRRKSVHSNYYQLYLLTARL